MVVSYTRLSTGEYQADLMSDLLPWGVAFGRFTHTVKMQSQPTIGQWVELDLDNLFVIGI
jgi:hypothetical protein